MNMLFYIAIILLAGIGMAKLSSLVKLPNVTGYLVAGLLIGPSVLKIIPQDVTSQMGILSEAALGMIAFSIGSEFNFKYLKKLGTGIIILTVVQALGAFIAVFAAMAIIFRQNIAFSLLISSIAMATAPAATLMVVRQYKAKGPLVDTLLPVVAIDDAVCIIAFGLSTAVARSILNPNERASLAVEIFKPMGEIVLAIAIGFFLGIVLLFIKRKVRGEDELLGIILGILFLGISLAIKLNLSSLLLCMALGTAVTNFAPNAKKVFSIIDRFTPPLYVAFFTISGAELDLGVLKYAGLMGIGYILTRSIGKIAGAYIGSICTGASKNIRKYLGITLLPQAGVAIGLSMVVQVIIPEYGASIRAIVLCATLIYELVGPALTKLSLIKAGEIETKSS